MSNMRTIAASVVVAGAIAFGTVVSAQNVPSQFVVSGKAAETIQDYTTINLATAQKIGALAPASGDGKPTKKVTIKKVTIAESPSSTAGSTPPAAPPSS